MTNFVRINILCICLAIGGMQLAEASGTRKKMNLQPIAEAYKSYNAYHAMPQASANIPQKEEEQSEAAGHKNIQDLKNGLKTLRNAGNIENLTLAQVAGIESKILKSLSPQNTIELGGKTIHFKREDNKITQATFHDGTTTSNHIEIITGLINLTDKN